MKNPRENQPADVAREKAATPTPKYEPPSVKPAGRVEQITLEPQSCGKLPPNNPFSCQ